MQSTLTSPHVCRFAAAQWHDATRKNYYVKYSARIMLGMHLGVNVSALPMIARSVGDVERAQADLSPGAACDVTTDCYRLQVTSAMVSHAA